MHRKTIVYSNVIIEDFRIVRRNVVRNDYLYRTWFGRPNRKVCSL